MAKTNQYLGGLPTEPDVKALLEAFPSLAPGDEIRNEQIAEVVRSPWRSSRFRTVVGAFRKRLLRDHNLDTKAVSGVGLRVLTEPERVTESIGGFRKGVRGVRRGTTRIALVKIETLAPEEQKRADHARRLMEATYSAAVKSTKEIAESYKPPPQLPRRSNQ